MHEEKESRRFDPKNLDKLEDQERQKYFPVELVLDAIGVHGSLTVADIGAGTGYFALPIAHRVAPAKVYAVDPSPELLDVLRGKCSREGSPSNLIVKSGEAVATTLPDAACDLILLSAVWHEIEDQPAALREFKRIAAPNAKLAIVDWSPDATRPPGPPTQHRIPRDTVERTVEEAGWGIVKSDTVSPFAYLVVAQR